MKMPKNDHPSDGNCINSGGALATLIDRVSWVMSLTLFMSIIKTVTSLLLILQIVPLP